MADWVCEAYGEDGPAVGAVCFFSDWGRPERSCTSEEHCHTRMIAERQRVFRRINELAATGDPDMIPLAEEFTHPDQLLGGDAET